MGDADETDGVLSVANLLNEQNLGGAGMNSRSDPGEIRVVAIDDEQTVLGFYKTALEGSGTHVQGAADPVGGLALVEAFDPALVLLDLNMPGMDGLQVLEQIRARNLRTQVVMITGNYSIETAVEAIRKGATDYVCKPVSVEKLRSLVEQARLAAHQYARAEHLEKELIEVFTLEGIIGRDPHMLEVFDLLQRIAPHFRTALILGETGTGKELVARALHNLSPRKSQRWAVCNCAAMVETLIESQLFGHRKGAFTGALEDRVGLFEWANGGTVFLDEIGELSPGAQSKLLRVLENHEVQKLGTPQPQRVDTLVVAATSRDLSQEVKSGRFRADLWYRLNMVQVQLPPLRERREDVLLLSRHFMEDFSREYNKEIRGISLRAQNALLAYSWPGNVRELENVIGRACMLCKGKFLDLDDMPETLRQSGAPASAVTTTMQDAEKLALLRTLAITKNRALAARMLGISRAKLYRLLEKYGLERDIARAEESEAQNSRTQSPDES
jgi:DNA-binding NtrC family response regulator